MSTIGWIFILAGVWLLRAVVKGEVFDNNGNFVLFSNLNQTVLGLITGTPPNIEHATKADLTLATQPEQVGDLQGLSGTVTQPQIADSSLLAAARRRGEAATGYRWAATGPTVYDCSGLVWRAIQDAYPAVAKLPRFTTFTMLVPPWRSHFTPSTEKVGAIVLWRSHVGIVDGPGTFYSARNPRAGIGTSKIAGFLPSEPAPTYWEFKP